MSLAKLGQRDEALAAFDRAIAARPTALAGWANKAALLQALKAGLGIGFAASYLVGPGTGLQRILPALPLPQLPLWLVTHREIVNNPLIRSCFDGLAEDLTRRL